MHQPLPTLRVVVVFRGAGVAPCKEAATGGVCLSLSRSAWAVFPPASARRPLYTTTRARAGLGTGVASPVAEPAFCGVEAAGAGRPTLRNGAGWCAVQRQPPSPPTRSPSRCLLARWAAASIPGPRRGEWG
eukprot:scaffold1236_cov503-Prasinococcus_capsulatus_cf.AAC.5